jgi:aryl-alcohol dehydrogenase-like predicted oxidoreductase
MITGHATREGTSRYSERFRATLSGDHFREVRGITVSSIGLGTYLGEPTESDDRTYEAAVRRALAAGCNVIDTAINYRFQRSERSVGAAIEAVVEAGKVHRDEIVVATKGGFIPFDGDYPEDPSGYLTETFVRPGLAALEEFVARCHCLAPRYIDDQFERSRRNLGLETIDIYYVHNPETQLQEVSRPEFRRRLREAFEILERKVLDGKLVRYGTATWDGFRLQKTDEARLSLAEVQEEARAAAKAVGESEHHFGAIQLPLNLAMPEAILSATQENLGGGDAAARSHVSLLQAAAAAGLLVMASASILQGHLVASLPPRLAEKIPGGATNAQKAIQWVRSAPGLATALVGMRALRHVDENLALAAHPRMSGEQFLAFLAPRG